MSATMARQGGHVQFEQVDMGITFNMVNIAKHGILYTRIEETKNLIKKPQAETREKKRLGVELPNYQSVKAVIEKHMSMIYNNYFNACLGYENKIAQNPATRWWYTSTKPGTTTVPAVLAVPAVSTVPSVSTV